MKKRTKTKSAAIDLLIMLLMTLFPVIIYLFFEEQWRALNTSSQVNFPIKSMAFMDMFL